MALELVPGGELWSICNKRGVHPCHAAYWAAQIGEALQHLHEKRIVHRDIKPENVLLTREGRAKLIDFGSAKLLDAVAPDAPLRLKLGLKVWPLHDIVITNIIWYIAYTREVGRRESYTVQ